MQDYSGLSRRPAAPRRRSRPRLLGRPVPSGPAGPRLLEVLLSSLLVAWLLAAGASGGSPGWEMGEPAAALALACGFAAIAVWLYRPATYAAARGLLLNTAAGVALAFPAIWLLGRLAGLDFPGLAEPGGRRVVQVLLGVTLLVFALRLAFGWALRAGLFVRRVLIIGPADAADRLAAAIRAGHRGFYEVAGMLPAAETAERQALASGRDAAGRRLWGVVLAGAAMPPRQGPAAPATGLRLYADAAFWERRLRRIDPAAAPCRTAAPRTGVRRLPQRPFDIALSLALLALTLPLMLLTALAIRLDSPGPVLYRQERVGLGGRVFTLLKFRSMRRDAEAAGPVWAAQRDARVTRVGGLIRMVRIDELPQLLNILKGEMSFIGPRPERPHFVAQLEQVLPGYAERALVKPGLTGWAQVNYPYGASVEDARAKLSYDLYYVRNRSLWLDLLILLATVRVVLFQHGAR